MEYRAAEDAAFLIQAVYVTTKRALPDFVYSVGLCADEKISG
ncbi:MAG: hypothetical protein ACRDSJ_22610 [Rubrobacteraceae bacterium]